MTTICVGCGLEVDGLGRIGLELESVGADMGSDNAQLFPAVPTHVAGAYAGIDLSMDMTNSSDCFDKSLFIGCTSDLANGSANAQGIEHKIEVSIAGGGFFTMVQAQWFLAWDGSWQEVIIPTGGFAVVAPGASINVRIKTTFTTFNTVAPGPTLRVAQGSCFGMLVPRSS